MPTTPSSPNGLLGEATSGRLIARVEDILSHKNSVFYMFFFSKYCRNIVKKYCKKYCKNIVNDSVHQHLGHQSTCLIFNHYATIVSLEFLCLIALYMCIMYKII
jgi:hypothetical protein